MPRVKRGTNRRDSRRKTLGLASGYFLTKSKLYRSAQEAVEKALKYAYVGRKDKKRDFRKIWIVRINAACRETGLSYSQFMYGLKLSGNGPRSQGARGNRHGRSGSFYADHRPGEISARSQGLTSVTLVGNNDVYPRTGN